MKQRMCSLTVLGAIGPKSRCRQGCAPLEASGWGGEGRRPPLPWPPWLPAALTPRGVWQHRSGPFAWPCVSVAPSSCEDPVIRAPLLQRGRLVTNHIDSSPLPKGDRDLSFQVGPGRWVGGTWHPGTAPLPGQFPSCWLHVQNRWQSVPGPRRLASWFSLGMLASGLGGLGPMGAWGSQAPSGSCDCAAPGEVRAGGL